MIRYCNKTAIVGRRLGPEKIDCVGEWIVSESCMMESSKTDPATSRERTIAWHDQLAHVRGSGNEGLNEASVVEPVVGRLRGCARGRVYCDRINGDRVKCHRPSSHQNTAEDDKINARFLHRFESKGSITPTSCEKV